MSDHIHLIDTGETDHGRAVFELEHSYQYSWPLYVDRPGIRDSRNRVAVHVPAGFRTDFASIPRMFWRIFNPSGKWRRAALVHDYLYSVEANCPRFLADAVFRHIMEQDGVRWCSRVIIYYAVRLFARRGYHRR